jgi:hypothetical protein
MARGFCPSGIFLKYDNNVLLKGYFLNMARGFCPSGIFLKYDNNVSSLRNISGI